MTDRMKLKVTEVKEVKKIGQADALPFLAAGPNGKRLSYVAWSKSIFEHIKKDAELDVEVDVKVSEKKDQFTGENYVSRNVVQLYVDGKPLIVQKPNTGRSWGKSPEDLKLERASIEAQVAVKAITDLEIAGRAVKVELIERRDKWLTKALS